VRKCVKVVWNYNEKNQLERKRVKRVVIGERKRDKIKKREIGKIEGESWVFTSFCLAI
jgi:hypothetical protein